MLWIVLIVLLVALVKFILHLVLPRNFHASGEVIPLDLSSGKFQVLYYCKTDDPKGIVILGTGDGGWSYWEENTAQSLISKGYAVGGWDCRKFADTRTYDQAKLAEVRSNLSTMNPEMSIERDLDLTVPNKIFALQQQRQDLLSRYLPTAQPVKDIDAQIASLQTMMSSGRGVGEATHKMGVNTVYQGLVTQKMDLEADMASVNGRMVLLQRQAIQVLEKLQGLSGLEAENNRLATERNALQDNLKTLTQRIQENQAAQEMTKGSDDTVRVVEKASMPDKPKSLKRVVMILSFLFAGFTALCAGLLRVYTRKGFANAEMAAKALDLPVLAQAKTKAA